MSMESAADLMRRKGFAVPEPEPEHEFEVGHPPVICPECHRVFPGWKPGRPCLGGTVEKPCPGTLELVSEFDDRRLEPKVQEVLDRREAERRADARQSRSGGLTVRRASEVPDQPIVRAFGGRLLQGTFSLVVGPGDAGKGMLIAEIVSHLTNGRTFPNERQGRPPMNVLILTTEDSEGIFKARLRVAGADLDRVFFLTGPNISVGGLQMPARITLHDDASELLRTAKEVNAGALMIETLVEHFGDRNFKTRQNTHSDADVRQALIPLRTVCEQAALFGLAVLHPRKSSEGGVSFPVKRTIPKETAPLMKASVET